MSKKFENIFELNHVEDLRKATELASDVQFNSIRCSGFEQKIIRDNGVTQVTATKPFIGLRQGHDPVLGFRFRSKSLADALLKVLHNIMADKNPIIPEPAQQVTYHDTKPDWEVKYTDLVKAILEATKNVHDLSALIHALEQDHPNLVEELNNED